SAVVSLVMNVSPWCITQGGHCKIEATSRTTASIAGRRPHGKEGVMSQHTDASAASGTTRHGGGTEGRDTRERLIDAISVHGPITARQLAERFGLTSAAVRRHLAALQADEVIAEHEVRQDRRGRGRPSKAFVLSQSAHESLPVGYDELASL